MRCFQLESRTTHGPSSRASRPTSSRVKAMWCDVVRSAVGDEGARWVRCPLGREARVGVPGGVWLQDRSWFAGAWRRPWEIQEAFSTELRGSLESGRFLQSPSVTPPTAHIIGAIYVRAYCPGDTCICGWLVWPNIALAKKPFADLDRVRLERPSIVHLVSNLGRQADICPGF